MRVEWPILDIAADLHRVMHLRQMASAGAARNLYRRRRPRGVTLVSFLSGYFAGAAAGAAAGEAVNSPLTSNGFTSIVPFISFADASVPV